MMRQFPAKVLGAELVSASGAPRQWAITVKGVLGITQRFYTAKGSPLSADMHLDKIGHSFLFTADADGRLRDAKEIPSELMHKLRETRDTPRRKS